MEYKLKEHQLEAISKLENGKILYGGVGSGKTITALYFYKERYPSLDLYVITTAKKRDSGDWEHDAKILDTDITVDSWNNIKKYKDIKNSFFIFDEHRAIGYSAWGRSFIKIAKQNNWILLTATPGDTWMDYIPVFIANGFYKHKTDFIEQHVEYDPYVPYPKVKRYHNEGKLIRNRRQVLQHMPAERHTTRHRRAIFSEFDLEKYNRIMSERWNIFEDKPIENASELTHCLRKVVSTDPDRMWNAKVIIDVYDRIIVFYNYNYELEILKTISEELGREYYQWNGHLHEDIPDTKEWVYLVQYTAGAEGWNCVSTNAMLFYSLNYSFRTMEQSEGRIDRMNTEYIDLEYYYLTSKSSIDKATYRAVDKKKKFNIGAWVKRRGLVF